MRHLMLIGAAAIGFSLVNVGGASAAPPCMPSPPVQVDCDTCEDPNGNPAPPQPCQQGFPGFTTVNCTLWVNNQCVIG